jgi:hypothetical protein
MRRPLFLPLVLCPIAQSLILPCVGDGQIVSQCVNAVGGSRNLGKIQTLVVDGTVQTQGEERSGTYAFRVKLPNRYYAELKSGGKTEIESYNGKSAWHQKSSGQTATLLGAQAMELELGRDTTMRDF